MKAIRLLPTTQRRKRCLVWHRRDLRFDDNALYDDGHRSDKSSPTTEDDGDDGIEIWSLYVLDPREFVPRRTAFDSSSWSVTRGPHASRLLLEALTKLRNRLRLRSRSVEDTSRSSSGGRRRSSNSCDLLIRRGDPALVIPALCAEFRVDEVRWSHEPGAYEQEISEAVKQNILTTSSTPPRIVIECTGTLYHPDDLPYRDSGLWSRLAHPKQRCNKHNNKPQQLQQPSLQFTSSIDANALPTTQTNDGNPRRHVLQGNDEVVDMSKERFVGMPRIMGEFRRACRSYAKVRPLRMPPTRMSRPNNNHENENDCSGDKVDPGLLPTMQELTDPIRGVSLLGLPVAVTDQLIDDAIRIYNKRKHQQKREDGTLSTLSPGDDDDGEDDDGAPVSSRALEWLHKFVDSGQAARVDRGSADGVHGSRLSESLSVGVLSPRQIYHAAAMAVSSVDDDSDSRNCQWLIHHMEIRDYFWYNSFYLGKEIFARDGPVTTVSRKKTKRQPNNNRKNQPEWKAISQHSETFIRWATGQTGFPLVDAAMKELAQTGFCSNRVRQNAASFLAKDLGLDWRAGAEWFQICLADHCVAANYGNWSYFAGTGSDPKNRHFRTISQAMRYDPDGTYVRKWLPILGLYPSSNDHDDVSQACFRPWDYGIEGWPIPMVDVSTQYSWIDMQQVPNHSQQ